MKSNNIKPYLTCILATSALWLFQDAYAESPAIAPMLPVRSPGRLLALAPVPSTPKSVTIPAAILNFNQTVQSSCGNNCYPQLSLSIADVNGNPFSSSQPGTSNSLDMTSSLFSTPIATTNAASTTATLTSIIWYLQSGGQNICSFQFSYNSNKNSWELGNLKSLSNTLSNTFACGNPNNTTLAVKQVLKAKPKPTVTLPALALSISEQITCTGTGTCPTPDAFPLTIVHGSKQFASYQPSLQSTTLISSSLASPVTVSPTRAKNIIARMTARTWSVKNSAKKVICNFQFASSQDTAGNYTWDLTNLQNNSVAGYSCNITGNTLTVTNTVTATAPPAPVVTNVTIPAATLSVIEQETCNTGSSSGTCPTTTVFPLTIVNGSTSFSATPIQPTTLGSTLPLSDAAGPTTVNANQLPETSNTWSVQSGGNTICTFTFVTGQDSSGNYTWSLNSPVNSGNSSSYNCTSSGNTLTITNLVTPTPPPTPVVTNVTIPAATLSLVEQETCTGTGTCPTTTVFPLTIVNGSTSFSATPIQLTSLGSTLPLSDAAGPTTVNANQLPETSNTWSVQSGGSTICTFTFVTGQDSSGNYTWSLNSPVNSGNNPNYSCTSYGNTLTVQGTVAATPPPTPVVTNVTIPAATLSLIEQETCTGTGTCPTTTVFPLTIANGSTSFSATPIQLTSLGSTLPLSDAAGPTTVNANQLPETSNTWTVQSGGSTICTFTFVTGQDSSGNYTWSLNSPVNSGNNSNYSCTSSGNTLTVQGTVTATPPPTPVVTNVTIPAATLSLVEQETCTGTGTCPTSSPFSLTIVNGSTSFSATPIQLTSLGSTLPLSDAAGPTTVNANQLPETSNTWSVDIGGSTICTFTFVTNQDSSGNYTWSLNSPVNSGNSSSYSCASSGNTLTVTNSVTATPAPVPTTPTPAAPSTIDVTINNEYPNCDFKYTYPQTTTMFMQTATLYANGTLTEQISLSNSSCLLLGSFGPTGLTSTTPAESSVTCPCMPSSGDYYIHSINNANAVTVTISPTNGISVQNGTYTTTSCQSGN